MVEIVLAFEDEFHIEIPDEDAEKIGVGEAVDYIKAHADESDKLPDEAPTPGRFAEGGPEVGPRSDEKELPVAMKAETAIGELPRVLMLSAAESCTGGLVADRITDVSGSSDYFMGGAVTIRTRQNPLPAGSARRLRIPRCGQRALRPGHGQGARQAFDTDVSISTTGIAGPGGATAQKPSGSGRRSGRFSRRDPGRHLQVHAGDRRQVKEAGGGGRLLDLLLEVLRGL